VDLYNLCRTVFCFTSLLQNLTPFAKGYPFRSLNHQIQLVQYPLYNFSFKSTQSQTQIHYSVACKVLSTASGFSARYHRHYYSLVLIPKDIAVIHFAGELQIQPSKLVFHERISCRWEDGKATQLTVIFLLQPTTPFYSHSQNSSTLLALHPRFHHHTLPHPNHECDIEADNGVSLRRECQASWSDHSERFGCQRLFSHYIHLAN
jgi:hypothetical protein